MWRCVLIWLAALLGGLLLGAARAQDITVESLPDPLVERQKHMKELWDAELLEPEQAPDSGARLEVTPDVVVFRGFGEKGTLRISINGKPAAPETVTGLRFEEHTYIKDMFSLKWSDTPGEMRIMPVDGMAEDGTYVLSIYAAGRKQTVVIEFRLPGEPLTQRLPREDVAIQLPEEVLLGQRLRITVESDPERRYVWLVNGEVAHETEGWGAFTYVPEQTGLLELGLREYEKGKRVASWDGSTMVTGGEPLEWRLERGAQATLTPERAGLAEYEKYQWYLDGELKGTARTFQHHFTQPGVYALTVLATGAKDDNAPFAFREVTWKVVVE